MTPKHLGGLNDPAPIQSPTPLYRTRALSNNGSADRSQWSTTIEFNKLALASAWRWAAHEAVEEGRPLMGIRDRLPMVAWRAGDQNIPREKLLWARASWYFQ